MKNNLKDMTLQEVKELCSTTKCRDCPLNFEEDENHSNGCLFAHNVLHNYGMPHSMDIDFPIPQKPLTKEQLYFLYGAYMMGAKYITPPPSRTVLYKCTIDVSGIVTEHRFTTPDSLEFEKVFFPYTDNAILIEDLLKAGGMFG